MPIDPLEGGGFVVSGALAMKAIDFAVSRFVRKADSQLERAAAEQADRERAMNEKLDQLLREVAEIKVETRNDRERASATAAAIQAAVSEVKARIDGVSANHGPRLGNVEQDIAALRARLDLIVAGKGRR